jgi:hypothetical protein
METRSQEHGNKESGTWSQGVRNMETRSQEHGDKEQLSATSTNRTAAPPPLTGETNGLGAATLMKLRRLSAPPLSPSAFLNMAGSITSSRFGLHLILL